MTLQVWVTPDENTAVTFGTLPQGQPVLSLIGHGCAVRVAVPEDVHGSAMGVRVARDLVEIAREFLNAAEAYAFHSAQAYRAQLEAHAVVPGEVEAGANRHARRDGE
ncbi:MULTISPECIES: hypothetical protein [unclassified Crossiella]|uniref:hypothetical protein n=1 Tax=unclassified Crossiella TaxID=2620835 RepID=UPI001FFEFB44|nr:MULTISPECIES: hypothetical protein [unclassified Crossiella]MCK2238402.1 hypothetical protein [Crossiella sp. S99.2]MCK2256442.1 hypothetical protein [Crossiella sp. S99.1]